VSATGRNPEARAAQPDLAQLGACTLCPRLASALKDVRQAHPGYHALPVAPFGDPVPRLMIVGLAPGLHGANRSGRPFTGDYAGGLLYETLHRFGWSNAPVSISADDGLALTGCRITNAVKCWPPANKPLPEEIRTCNAYLREELQAIQAGGAVLALGQIAHVAVLRALELKPGPYPFGHGNSADLPSGARLFDSYHCSRYNTQTRRLTTEMFSAVFEAIATHLERA
jgi:uracil-DNA glycosylase family 4